MIPYSPPPEQFPPCGEEKERFERDLLLRLKQALSQELGISLRKTNPSPPHPLLHLPIGAFFTVKVWGRLRGCLGWFSDGHTPLLQLVETFAPRVLREDPRFPPVTVQEAPGISLEVSLLYDFAPMNDPEDFTPGVHGIVLQSREGRATLLPQVALEEGLDRQGFLKALLRKMERREGEGFPSDTSFYRYRAYVVRGPLIFSNPGTGYTHPPLMESFPSPPRILFICAGNICRSPSAMVILRAELDRRKLPGTVESRGVVAQTGAGIERTTARILRQLGYPLPPHKATPLLYEDRDRFDLFLAMDAWIKEEAERILSAPPPEVYRLLDFLGKPGDIPDPYQADERIIADTIRRIESAVKGLCAKLSRDF